MILSHEEKCLFLMYFWTLNSNMFPEFIYHPHFSLIDSESSDEDVDQANNSMVVIQRLQEPVLPMNYTC